MPRTSSARWHRPSAASSRSTWPDCAECRRAVAELSPAVGLLSRADRRGCRAHRRRASPTMTAAGRREPPGRDPLVREGAVAPPSPHAGRRARRRCRADHRGGGRAVRSVVVRAAGRGVVRAPERRRDPARGERAATSVDWGTRIELTAGMPTRRTRMPDASWTYALAVVGRGGRRIDRVDLARGARVDGSAVGRDRARCRRHPQRRDPLDERNGADELRPRPRLTRLRHRMPRPQRAGHPVSIGGVRRRQLCDLPAEPSCWVASTTRAAIADSATLPQARGS